MLDLAVSQPTVGVLRDQGFLTGFGIDVKDPSKWGDEEDPRIVGNDVTAGNEEGGRRAMENLLAKDPMINVVYTINEPAAAGAYEALKAIGREGDVLIVSVDGGCPGVRQRQGRRHWRDLAAVSAADGLQGHRSHRRMGQGRHQAGADRRQELL
jgi:fructose transport system substrate-binding protein